MLASRNGFHDVAVALIAHGAAINVADTSGNTALHYACAYGHQNIMRLLVKEGADGKKENAWKVTPLLIALLKGHDD